MSLPREYDSQNTFPDFSYEEEGENLSHKKRIRRLLEEKLERKRLKQQFDELDGEFDWDELER